MNSPVLVCANFFKRPNATQSKSTRTNSTHIHRQTSATEVKFHLDQSFDLPNREDLVLCCVISRFLRSCETAQHAPHRMEHRPGSRRLVAHHQRSMSAVEQVARQRPSIFQAHQRRAASHRSIFSQRPATARFQGKLCRSPGNGC